MSLSCSSSTQLKTLITNTQEAEQEELITYNLDLKSNDLHHQQQQQQQHNEQQLNIPEDLLPSDFLNDSLAIDTNINNDDEDYDYDVEDIIDSNYYQYLNESNLELTKIYDYNNTNKIYSTSLNNKTNNFNNNKSNATTRDTIDTLTDISSSDNEVDLISLLDENIPKYKLRADTTQSNNNNNNCDWIRAPLYIDEQQISELTNEQISFTLDYFILSGYRVSQMTKTYYDIEAVTKLLDEKERDLELAATIGKQLLEKDQQLEFKIELLEQELEKATEMVNQLRHEISLKDNLLKSFIDSEEEIVVNNNNVNVETVNYKKSSNVDTDTLNEYKRKITFLEDENNSLRNRAEYFEKETADLESKETYLIENCFKELETAQSSLKTTEDELKSKTTECLNQQDLINNLYAQIQDLKLRIKNLTQENNDLHSVYESSKADLLQELKDLKEKYNECIQLLSKSQEEISILRKKSNTKSKRSSTLTKSSSTLNNQTTTSLINSFDSSSMNLYDEDSEVDSNLYKPTSILSVNKTNSLYTPWMPVQATNSNSLAAEVFSTMAKDYRTKLPIQASQSSDFIKKVKQKLTKQLPGSNIESCLQSDSELELVLNSSNDLETSICQAQNTQLFNNSNRQAYLAKFTNCPTPDSILSTGSASIYSNMFARSSSFLLPEKLQIVKPIEGSQTLQHWQYLATPNLGCLFENRPGISIKGNHSESDKNSVKRGDNNENDDGVDVENDFDEENEDSYDYDYDDCDEQELDLINYFQNYNETLRSSSEHDTTLIEPSNSKGRLLSPSKVELLSKLLEKEERNQSQVMTSSTSFDPHALHSSSNNNNNNNNSIMGFIKNISNKYFRSSSLEANEDEDIKEKEITRKKRQRKRHEYDDPDTPPSSPINEPNTNEKIGQNIFEFAKEKLVDSLSSYFKPAPTPPGTPYASLELEEALDSASSDDSLQDINESGSKMQNFFDQIVNKLSLFTFKSVANTNNINTTLNSNQSISQTNLIFKPSAIYPNSHSHSETMLNNNVNKINFDLKTKPCNNMQENDIDEEIVRIEEESKKVICNTPPPSPSKFSPPLPDLEYQAYTEEDIKKSAFVKVTTLNPLINQSVDLASLLGSLSSLKRSQRLYN